MAELDLLFDAVCDDGTGPAGTGGRAGGRVQREVGVVITLDTLTSDDPTSHSTGEVRGDGVPGARDRRRRARRRRPGTGPRRTTCVLLTDRDGHLTRFLRIGRAPENGWTRGALLAATRRAIRSSRNRGTTPTPTPRPSRSRTSSAPATPSAPSPAAPSPPHAATSTTPSPTPEDPPVVQNLGPRSRRCHRYKTAALWHCRTLTSSGGTVIAPRVDQPPRHPPGRRGRTPAVTNPPQECRELRGVSTGFVLKTFGQPRRRPLSQRCSGE